MLTYFVENSVGGDLIRGNIDTIILKCLQIGDMYGTEIIKLVKEASNGTYILKEPTLYSALKRLKNNKLVSDYLRDNPFGGRKHYYSLNDAGKAYLNEKKEDWRFSKEVIDTIIFNQIDSRSKFNNSAVAPGNHSSERLELNLEKISANLNELDRGQSIKYEKLFEDTRQNLFGNILVDTAIAEVNKIATPQFNAYTSSGDFITVPLFNPIEMPAHASAEMPPPVIAAEIKPYVLNEQSASIRSETDTLFRYLSREEVAALSNPKPQDTSAIVFGTAGTAQRIELVPFTKHSQSQKDSNFVLFNKLRLVCAFIVCAILAVALGVCGTYLKPSFNTAERTFMVFAWLVPALYLIFSAAFYISYPKNKRTMKSRKWDILRRGGLMLSFAVAAVAFNLIGGLTNITAPNFLVYTVVPCILSTAFFLEGLVIIGLKRSQFFAV